MKTIDKASGELDSFIYSMFEFLTETKKPMIKTHKTKDGDTLLIAQMTDGHLTNFIELQLKKIEELKGMLNSEISISPLKGALYGIQPKKLAESASRQLPNILNLLYPYLSEALLRGGMGFDKRLQEVLERTGQEMVETSYQALTGPEDLGKLEEYINHKSDFYPRFD